MTGRNDPKTLAEFIDCLSILEDEAARLYNNLSVKVKHPLLRSLLFSIAQDSTKHGALLRGVADSLVPTRMKRKNCEKMGEPWGLLFNLNKETEKKASYSDDDFAELSEKLVYVESVLGEEYYMFVQTKTLERMIKEINQIYRIDLGGLKSIFTSIINDEERHREIVEKIQTTLKKKFKNEIKQKGVDHPLVKYTNPDNWISPFSQVNSP